MTVMMLLQDGPLDGERQVVDDNLPTTPGSQMIFNLPHYQTFAPDGVTVIDLGLEVIYTYLQPGPPPVPANGDTWDSSWVFEFVKESYVVPPGPQPIPPVPVSSQVWMLTGTGLTVGAFTLPGVPLVAQTNLDVEGLVTPTQWGIVTMQAVTTMQGAPITSLGVGLSAVTDMSGAIQSSTTYGAGNYGSGAYGQ